MTIDNAPLHALSVRDMTAAFAAGRMSPVDALEHALQRAERYQPQVNAFTFLDHAGARSAAEQSARRWRAGAPLSAVDGVVATVKANIATRDWSCQRGSSFVDAAPAADDAPIVAHLRAAGCTLLGQTTMPEFGWIGVTHSRLHGVTRNPWDPGRSPGGSSGGAAAAAALGIGHFHIGTDGAGSIRIPCAWSGLFGLMPGVGRVPAWPASPFGLLARLGPMTRKVEDGALMYAVLSAPDARDPFHDGRDAFADLACLERGIRGLRLAFSPTLGYVETLDPEIRDKTEAMARRLTEFGAIVEMADPGFVEADAWRPLSVLWNAACASVLDAFPGAEGNPDLDQGFLHCAEAGRRLAAADVMRAMAERAALHDCMRRFHAIHDALLTPTMPVTAIEAGVEVPRDGRFGESWFAWSPYTWPFNVTGQPAGTVPIGLDRGGLPIGLQIVAPPLREDTVFKIASAVERLAGFDWPFA